jgi:transposase-like protein
MVTINLKCRHCGSDNIVRNGLTRNGKQRYQCNECGRSSRDNPQHNGYSQQEREEILRAYEERSSLRGLTRTFGVARNTVSSWLKKKLRNSRP